MNIDSLGNYNAYALSQLNKEQATLEEDKQQDVAAETLPSLPGGAVTLPEVSDKDDEQDKDEDSESTQPPKQETILEGMQRVKDEIDAIRFSRDIKPGDKEAMLAPLQQELDDLVVEMQFAIKQYSTQQSQAWFNQGTENKQQGMLLDYLV
ncbi:hypothetical protein [Motilimonas pumila]|uniref:Uncharacterized protein n=1 Tax=Motilimonas pumila TaxID=2303987 RepID=A0A418YDK3_9GAMM|nr:hypothetical protein [Motilimonas pumila]RJG42597.1 hypothetical protein D1Z90_12060 [Motilimonas pumila]